MYTNIQCLHLLRHLPRDHFLLGLLNRPDVIVLYTFLYKAISFFLFSTIVAKLYRKRAPVPRYAIASALFAFLSIAPGLAINLILPPTSPLRLGILVIDPPHLIAIMYLLGVYILKVEKHLALIVVMKLYLVFLSNDIGFYIAEALSAYLFCNTGPHMQLAFFVAHTAMLLIDVGIALGLMSTIRRRKLWLDAFKLREAIDRPIPRTLAKYTLYGTLVFVPVTMALQFTVQQSSLAHIIVEQLCMVALCWMLLLSSYLSDQRRISRVDMANKDVYANALVSSIEESRRLWHDMNNMLQVYDGYIQVGDTEKLRAYHTSLYAETRATNDMVDIGAKYESNPALYSVLAAKAALARQQGLYLSIACSADASRVCIEPRDLSRIVGILLDNAIEETAQTPHATILFSLEEARGDRLLLSITNPTRGDVDVKRIMEKSYSTKSNHGGYGLHNLGNIINRNDPCRLNVEYANRRITFYVELPCAARPRPDGGAAIGQPA